MDVLTVAKKINLKICELEDLKASLPILAQEKALSDSEYEKNIALTVMGLKNGKSYDIDGQPIQECSTTLSERLAKGICYTQKLRMDLAESKYKNALKIIDITEAQLNGFQSINRYLSEV